MGKTEAWRWLNLEKHPLEFCLWNVSAASVFCSLWLAWDSQESLNRCLRYTLSEIHRAIWKKESRVQLLEEQRGRGSVYDKARDLHVLAAGWHSGVCGLDWKVECKVEGPGARLVLQAQPGARRGRCPTHECYQVGQMACKKTAGWASIHMVLIQKICTPDSWQRVIITAHFLSEVQL